MSDSDIPYTGKELRSHFNYAAFGVSGDSISAFSGPCDVPTENLVDMADRAAGETIKSDRMVHFIVELYGRGLEDAVLYQRILINIIKDVLKSLRDNDKPSVWRSGDDLYAVSNGEKRKLSVSIATVSPVSALVHAGVNVTYAGAPVAAAGLVDLCIDENEFKDRVLALFAEECSSIDSARVKVRGVS
jgi:hypothetical protein